MPEYDIYKTCDFNLDLPPRMSLNSSYHQTSLK